MIYLVSNQFNLYDNSLFEAVTLEEAINKLQKETELGIDSETEGLDVFTKKILLLQIGAKDYQVLFDIKSFECRIPEELRNFLNISKAIFIFQNAKFDLKFLFHQNIIIKNVYDTMLVEIILTNGLQYTGRDLKTITEKYCNAYLDKSIRGEIITKGLSNEVLVYGAKDVMYLSEIKRKQLLQINELNLINAVNLDNTFVIVLAYVEYCGIKLDFEKWKKRTHKNIELASNLRETLNNVLWKDKKYNCFSGMQDLFTGKQECIINWDSPKQVIDLFKSYGINVILKDKGEDKETIDAKVLEPQKDKFEILKPYLEYKAAQKTVSTYGLNWLKYISPVTGRIHTTYQQIMDTGRLSCGNKNDGTVNLQNIPSDEETRSCFICETGNKLVDADYSAQEQVVIANFSKEENLLNFYEKGFSDMHSYIAFLMYPEIRRCTLEELTPDKLSYIKKEYADKRFLAKTAGFAISYGGNGATIAKNCSIPKKDGEYVYKSYFESFPKLKEYFDLGFRKASHFGYVEFNSVTRRKYFFRKDNEYFKNKDIIDDPYFNYNIENPGEVKRKFSAAKSEIQRISQNYPIQGSASDITKYACVLFFKKILLNNWFGIVKIVNLIHDEILVECPEELVEQIKELLVESMKEAGKPFCKIVPLKAEALVGDIWVH